MDIKLFLAFGIFTFSSFLILAEEISVPDENPTPVIEFLGKPLSQNFSINISTNWGFSNLESLDLFNGYAPISYDISETPDSFTAIGDDEGREIGGNGGWGGLEIQGLYTLSLPFLEGANFLTQDNNLSLIGGLTLNPFQLKTSLSVVLTPLAFLNFVVASELGTGWELGDFGGGLGVYSDSGDVEYDSFSGVVSKVAFGAIFKADLAAVLPQPVEWKHITISHTSAFTYQVYSGALDGESWVFDDSQMFNGWKFITSTLIGYQIPNFPINFIGVNLSTSSYIGDVYDLSLMEDGGWGSWKW